MESEFLTDTEAPQARERRLRHRLSPAQLRGQELWLDGFNVVTAVETALGGAVILIGCDELLPGRGPSLFPLSRGGGDDTGAACHQSHRRALHPCPVCLRKLEFSVGFEVEKQYKALGRFYRQLGLEEDVAWVGSRLEKVRHGTGN